MKKIIPIILSAAIIPLGAWTLWANKTLTVTEYTVANDSLPDPFRGVRIAHISDLHNAKFGKKNEKLVSALASANPDVIVITGDIIDRNRTDVNTAVEFVSKAVSIAPCYFCTGNHECKAGVYEYLKYELVRLGVTVLENETAEIERDGERIFISGTFEPRFFVSEEEIADVMKEQINDISDEGFSLLLSHRPELFDIYNEKEFEVVFCGHAHGGQFRLPFVGGVFAPHQGIFPEYDCGLYEKNGTVMEVSRGLGNSTFPLRFNNRPEITVVTLEK